MPGAGSVMGISSWPAPPASLRRAFWGLMPRRFHLPLRYHARWLRRSLDPEMALLPSLAGERERAVDIGANYGVYTYALWRLFRRVEAFEPSPDCGSVIRAFGSDRISLHPVALSSHGGVASLQFARERGRIDLGRGSLSPPEERPDRTEVTVRTLDEYGFPDVNFMKVDVEGHELDVLRGAQETLARCQPNLLVEIEQRHLTIPMRDVFRFLEERGYRGFFLVAGSLVPVADFSYERHQQPYLANVYHPDYVNNFVFLPSGYRGALPRL